MQDDDTTDNDEYLCAQCNGSGEGQYDGTTCWRCKGRGTESIGTTPEDLADFKESMND